MNHSEIEERAFRTSYAVIGAQRSTRIIGTFSRLRLRDSRMRRVLDSTDICQGVLASFFIRAASGQYDLERPVQLLRLLVAMARNKLVSESRTYYVKRRERPGPAVVARGAVPGHRSGRAACLTFPRFMGQGDGHGHQPRPRSHDIYP